MNSVLVEGEALATILNVIFHVLINPGQVKLEFIRDLVVLKPK